MSLSDLRRRSNAGAAQFQLNPPGRGPSGEFSPVTPSASITADTGASLAPPNSPKLLVAIVKPYRLHNTKH